jgi:protein TonB
VSGRTQIVSIAIHAAVFAILFSISQNRAKHRATSVAVVNAEKKKAEPKKEPPKPKPVVATARPKEVTPQVAPKVVESAKPVAQPTEAPAETNIEMGNDDGPGIALGGPVAPKKEGPAQQQAPEKRAPIVKKEKVVAPKNDNPEEDTCSEAPSKPAPLQRPSEIEYTQEARANGVEGRLVLKITIGSDGSVLKVEVVSSVDAALDAAAIAAVKTWVFKPSMRCGKAMAGGTFMLARRFELGD